MDTSNSKNLSAKTPKIPNYKLTMDKSQNSSAKTPAKIANYKVSIVEPIEQRGEYEYYEGIVLSECGIVAILQVVHKKVGVKLIRMSAGKQVLLSGLQKTVQGGDIPSSLRTTDNTSVSTILIIL